MDESYGQSLIQPGYRCSSGAARQRADGFLGSSNGVFAKGTTLLD